MLLSLFFVITFSLPGPDVQVSVRVVRTAFHDVVSIRGCVNSFTVAYYASPEFDSLSIYVGEIMPPSLSAAYESVFRGHLQKQWEESVTCQVLLYFPL